MALRTPLVDFVPFAEAFWQLPCESCVLQSLEQQALREHTQPKAGREGNGAEAEQRFPQVTRDRRILTPFKMKLGDRVTPQIAFKRFTFPLKSGIGRPHPLRCQLCTGGRTPFALEQLGMVIRETGFRVNGTRSRFKRVARRVGFGLIVSSPSSKGS